jgi:hypothetical protein
MKRTLGKLLFATVVIFLISCGKEFYSVSITNNSTKTVSYTYNDISDTLNTSNSKTYEVKAYTQPPKNITDEHGIASLKMEHKDDHFIFTDATPLDLHVINKLSADITIKADNFIDNSNSTALTIEANEESTTAKIYTKSPKFTSTSHYPIIVKFTIAGNVMSVIIE